MRHTSFATAALLLISLSAPALAATSQDDADKLKASLQQYIGEGADAVTITPEGDGFKVVIDVSPLMEKAKADVTVSPIDFMMTPAGDGKWKVSHEGPFVLSGKSESQGFSFTENFESLTFNGEYDETLAAFTTMEGKSTNITFEEAAKDDKGTDMKASGKIASTDFKGTGAANSAGGVDVKFDETVGAGELTEDFTSPDMGGQPVHVNVKFGGGTFNGTVGGAKSAAILSFFKFMALHPDPKVSVSDQDELKGLLRDLLPGFASADLSGSFTGLEAETPIGGFKLAKLGVGIKANGLVKDGKVEETFSVEGLEIPPGLVPAWASSLVTKNASFGVQVSGYDLESFLKAEIDSADFSKDTPIEKDVEDKNAALIMPNGTVNVTLTQYNMSNDTYNVSATGSMTAGPTAQPSGQAHISIKGLDELMKVAQAAPPEAGLQSVTAVVVVAKGLAKPDADGALGWDIAATPDGKITVNGTDMSQLKQ